MERMFVFQDFKSQKFWSIDVQETGFTVKYGKLGTDGQVQEKSFANKEETLKQAEKLIAEKVKKGYVETSVSEASEMKVEAKKYQLTYDEYDSGKGEEDLLNKILNDKKLPDLKQITIGCWSYESGDCQGLMNGFVANKDKFKNIEGIFWGDIESEESETSWIELAPFSPLIEALPNLKDLKIKGGNGFDIGVHTLPNLKSFEVITGGLPASLVEQVIKSDFPNLEKLVLWVGVDDYGGDCNVDTFKPLLTKGKYPKLKHFGLNNSQIQDDLVELILNSEILPQLETLEIAYGALTDKGGQMLLDNTDKLKHLKFINMEWNFMSDEMIKKLKTLPCKIDVSDQQEAEEYDDEVYMYPMITE